MPTRCDLLYIAFAWSGLLRNGPPPANTKADRLMSKSFYDYCIESDKPLLLAQWHTDKNVGITPRDVTPGSHRKVWWVCEKGHEWQTAVYVRVASAVGCPYCTGKRPLKGYNTLADVHPDLAVQWHSEKNGNLAPDAVLPGSKQKVWWICEEGHEWQAQISSRSKGSGCPVCLNRSLRPGENDLSTAYPEIAAQWHPTKNGNLTPADVMSGNNRKVWWICEKGHEWQASIISRTRNACGCPVCTGRLVIPGINDLASQRPHIAAQWHPAKNGSLSPQNVTVYSNRYVWWRCEKGHEYQAAISRRSQSATDCPYCKNRKVLAGFNDLATVAPQIAAQWHPELNGSLTPEMVTAGSKKKVWWRCGEGHVWQAVIYSRTGERKHGCPVCAGTVSRKRRDRYADIMAESNIGTGISAMRPTELSHKGIE